MIDGESFLNGRIHDDICRILIRHNERLNRILDGRGAFRLDGICELAEQGRIVIEYERSGIVSGTDIADNAGGPCAGSGLSLRYREYAFGICYRSGAGLLIGKGQDLTCVRLLSLILLDLAVLILRGVQRGVYGKGIAYVEGPGLSLSVNGVQGDRSRSGLGLRSLSRGSLSCGSLSLGSLGLGRLGLRRLCRIYGYRLANALVLGNGLMDDISADQHNVLRVDRLFGIAEIHVFVAVCHLKVDLIG